MAPKSISKSTRAGLTLPVARISRKIRKKTSAKKITKYSAVYLTAIIEYIASEILNEAMYSAQNSGRSRVLPLNIKDVILNDQDFKEQFSNCIFPTNKNCLPQLVLGPHILNQKVKIIQ